METTVKTLFEKGYNKTQIGNMLGIDRKTVRKVLRNQDKDHKREKKPHPSVLDKHREFIEASINKELTNQRIFQDLQKKVGFEGSYSTVRDYVRKIKGEQQAVYMVIETLPGEEGQVDFGYIGNLKIGNKRRKAWIFVMTLSYSRYMFVKIVFDQSIKTFISCHLDAFRYFGGVPETVKIDNLKAGIIEANFYEPVVQRTYAAFAAHYGFWAQPTRVYTPTDKGKVERAVDYVKENCFKGRDFKNATEAADFLLDWLENVANKRIHGTTKKRPVEVFQNGEKAKLQPLNTKDFIFSDSAKATVNNNCHLAYKGNYYSAPFQYIGLELNLIEVNNMLKIYFDQEEVALHTLWEGEKGHYVTNKNHYPASKTITFDEILSRQKEEMAAIGPNASLFFEAFASKAGLRRYDYRTISGILALAKKYDSETVDAACARAHYFNSHSFTTVRKICEKGLGSLPACENEAYVNEMPNEFARDLKEYANLSELGVLQ
ncbi:MAG: IS21 family transposase [Bacillota bacterium]